MSRLLVVTASIVGIVVIAGLAWSALDQGKYESAEYKVIEKDGPFEIRDYPDLKLATTASKPGSQGRDGSFMRLFGYTSGANQGNQEIAMTVPVFMKDKTEEKEGTMGFVLPKEVATGEIPSPSSDKVKITTRKGGRFAVVRFAGRLDQKLAKDKEKELRAWMEKKKLVANGPVETAGYDAPFTPGPMRRNEVLIPIKPPEAKEVPESKTPAATES